MLYLLLCSLVMIVAMVKVHKVVLQMLEFLSTTEGARNDRGPRSPLYR